VQPFWKSSPLRGRPHLPRYLPRRSREKLRRYGMRASQTIDGSMTGKKFLAYAEQCLAPTLKKPHMTNRLPVPLRHAPHVRALLLRRTQRFF
jgi:hypothetical protein